MLGRGGLSAFAQRGLGTLYALLLDFKNGIYQQTRTRTNLCNTNGTNPVSGTGITKTGDAAAVLSVVDDSAALASAGLAGFCTSGKVIKLDNTAGTTNANLFFGSAATVSGQSYTFSIYMRATIGNAALQFSDTGGPAVTSIPSSYTRRTITATASSVGDLGGVAAGPGAVIYCIMQQLEAAPAASAYIPTTSAAVSVTENVTVNGAANVNQLYGYTYSRSGAKEEATSTGATAFAANVPAIIPGTGYFARPGYTNLVLWSQDFTNAAWTKTNCSDAINAIAPDGSTTAITQTVTASGVAAIRPTTNISFSASNTYTYSVLMKAGSTSWGYIQINTSNIAFAITFNLSTGTVGTTATLATGADAVGSGSIMAIGNGWYRCSVTFTAGAGTTFVSPYHGSCTTNDPTNRIAAAGETILLWQAQLVQASDPGPIIVTTSGTAAVGADALTLPPYVTTDQDFIMVATINFLTAPTVEEEIVSLNAGSSTNSIILQRQSNGTLGASVYSGGTFAGDLASGISQATAGRASVIIRRKAGTYVTWGKNSSGSMGQRPVNTSAYPVGLTQLELGSVGGNNKCKGSIETIYIRPGTFSDTDVNNILTAL